MRPWPLLLALAACGRAPAPRADGPTSAVSPTTLDPVPASADDVVVATVDGHPIYGSCVAAQAAGEHVDAKTALDQCVAFELLAREADARGLRADLDVAEAWRREVVRSVIEADLGKLTAFEQLPPAFLASIHFDQEQRPFLHRPEMRTAYYIRAEVPNTVLGSPADERAHALADAIYAEVQDRDDVTAGELFAIGEQLARDRGDPKPTHENKPKITPPKGTTVVRGTVPEFRDAVYALPAIGTVHAPVRTAWGWDVIMWHDTLPAADLTDQLFQADLRRYFVPWSDGIARGLGIAYSHDEALLKTLAEPEDATALATPEPPG